MVDIARVERGEPGAVIYAVLGTGSSMSQQVADYLKDKCSVICVSDSFRLAPWGKALVSNDSAWWRQHPDALKFAGRKFCASQIKGAEYLKTEAFFGPGSNSGLQAMRVAHQIFGAKKILLCGFDMRGGHYFGAHPEPLKNTTKSRFRVHIRQFLRWKGCEVINCTPNSALTRFQFSTIEEQLPCLKAVASA